jgi:hypothetical protein
MKPADQPSPKPSDPATRREVGIDLKAAMAARRELGEEMEDHVVESFLARIEQYIDARVAERLAQNSGARPARSEGTAGKYEAALVVASGLVLAIPLIAVSGANGSNEAVPIMGIILVIDWLYFHFRFRRR